ncbi:hypothetical protein [Cellulomonas sp. P5_C6]
MRRTLFARVSALTLLAVAALVPAGAAVAAPIPPANLVPALGFYSVPYSDQLLWAHAIAYGTEYRWATYAEWSGQGFPSPMRASAQYVKAPWFSTIVATPVLPANNPRPLPGEAQSITFDQWARAGYPTPTVTTSVPFMQYTKEANGSTIWAVQGPLRHALTYAEWASAGYPTPTITQPSYRVLGWSTSSELFTAPNDNSAFHKLSFAEYAGMGYPSFGGFLPGGFYKLSWDDNIVLSTPSGPGEVLTFDRWKFYDFPTPVVASTIPGDEYCFDTEVGELYYDGVTVRDYLTDQEARTFLGIDPTVQTAC